VSQATDSKVFSQRALSVAQRYVVDVTCNIADVSYARFVRCHPWRLWLYLLLPLFVYLCVIIMSNGKRSVAIRVCWLFSVIFFTVGLRVFIWNCAVALKFKYRYLRRIYCWRRTSCRKT